MPNVPGVDDEGPCLEEVDVERTVVGLGDLGLRLLSLGLLLLGLGPAQDT